MDGKAINNSTKTLSVLIIIKIIIKDVFIIIPSILWKSFLLFYV